MVKLLLLSSCFIAITDIEFIRQASELSPTGVNVLTEGSNPVAEYVLLQNLYNAEIISRSRLSDTF